MKKLLIVSTVLLFVLCGCRKKQKVEEVIEEKEPEIVYKMANVLVDNYLVEYALLDRGVEIDITYQDEDYYYFNYNDIELAISRTFVRTELEDVFVEYLGYARSGAQLYKDLACSQSIASLSLNENVKVIDNFAGVLLVEYDGKQAYMYPSKVSSTKIVTQTANPTQESTSSSDNSYSYSDDPSPSPSPSPDPTPDPDPEPTPDPDPVEEWTEPML